mmetsp:Transcript_37143/g.82628  ORF Transcript_37143/g.82628 Transcript_37143/m.82628 type:complete len:524 (+) Transcript_37143:55-1626(+)|eukprot:CAMPEP_0202906854 /NCGR_PEP_ID=MMETSP1392-20130828/40507_1 /ASSEMBLY_ACC=CAM_ASM_000868 /TAXON_ID=225041 /ORGANISM="Chlamydomonas chlamydogama, Strain SAG 11-48b" /LENGTH=523 /DNA_ID=CAMNT_0049595527 /DNA_START=53 /DNA_END=1624 /DNA_ORIENTATION=+
MQDGAKLQCMLWYCAISFVFGIQASIVGPTASLLAKQTSSTEADLAPVLGMSGFCLLLGGLPSGWLMDHVPGHAVLATSLIIQTIGFILMPACPSVLLLVLCYGAVSLTFNAVNTGINCLVIWLLSPAPVQPSASSMGGAGLGSGRAPRPWWLPTLGSFLNLLSVTFGIGGLASPQIINLMTWLTGSGMNAYYVAAAMSAAAALAMLCLSSPPHPSSQAAVPPASQPEEPTEFSVGIDDTGRKLLMDTNDGSKAAAPSHVQALEQPPPIIMHSSLHDGSCGPLGDLLPDSVGLAQRARLKVVFMGAFMLLVFANMSLELGFGNWIYTYCVRQAGLDEEAGQQITSLYWLAFTLGRVPAIFMATWFPVSNILLLMMPLSVVGGVLPLVQPPSATGTASSSAALITGSSTMLVALGAAAGFPCSLSMATEYVEIDGFMNGVVSTVCGVGATVFPFVVPLLAKWYPVLGFQWLMLATLLMASIQLAGLLVMISAGKAMGPRQQRQYAASHEHSLTKPLLPSSHMDA